MSKATLYNYSVTGTSVIDEMYQDVGSSTFQLGTVKRAFAGGSEFSISPGDAASHYLVEGVDYELVDEDFNYTEECGFAVYTGVKILNSDYQSGELAISYLCIGSYTDITPILEAMIIVEETDEVLSVLLNPSYLNLTAKLNATTPATQVDVAWDGLRIGDRYTTSQSFTLNIAQSGALGLDTGSPANSTWYYLWAICNDAGTTVSAILSASATAPTLPSGYTKKRLVSAVYRQSNGTFRAYQQLNNSYCFDSISVLTDGSATSYTIIDISSVIPVGACAISGTIRNGSAGYGTYISPNNLGYGHVFCVSGAPPTYAPYYIPVINQSIYYKVTSGSVGSIWITGFEINL